MLSFADILVFVAALSVKFKQAVCVLREMSGNPVKNNADSLSVALVNKVHEVLRLAIARGRGKIAGYLIAP